MPISQSAAVIRSSYPRQVRQRRGMRTNREVEAQVDHYMRDAVIFTGCKISSPLYSEWSGSGD